MSIQKTLEEMRRSVRIVRRPELAKIQDWAHTIEAEVRQKDAEIERLTKEVEKWQYAFSAQSHKLESVLHIPGVRAVLSGKEDPHG
jgi:ribosome recycling factor